MKSLMNIFADFAPLRGKIRISQRRKDRKGYGFILAIFVIASCAFAKTGQTVASLTFALRADLKKFRREFAFLSTRVVRKPLG
ncbi:MAG TPA: hypothetical protein VIY49_27715 [Bryobacteraceae bacterium]